jgi:hypothetical protein
MGQGYDATCNACGHKFEVMKGGGMAFEQVDAPVAVKRKRLIESKSIRT